MTDAKRFERGDLIPHFEVRAHGGQLFRYSTIWQHKNLVLVTVPPACLDHTLLAELAARAPDFDIRNSVCVVTADSVPGLPTRGVVVADRWGEIGHVAAPADMGGLPTASDLLEWLDYIQQRCPECEGEAK